MQQLTPAVAVTASALSVQELGNATADSKSRVFTLRVGGGDTELSCTIVAASTSCSDTTHTVTIPPHSQISFKRTLESPGSGDNGLGVQIAYRLTAS